MRPKSVGVIHPGADPFCREVLRGALVVLAQCRWDCRLIRVEDLPGAIDADELDGLIGRLDPLLRAGVSLPDGLPAVDAPCDERRSGIATVGTDQAAVGRCAAEYLLSLGIPHFGFFGSAEARAGRCRQAFIERLGRSGRTCCTFSDIPGGHERAPDERTARLARWIAFVAKPIVVLAECDELGLRLLRACRELGVAVPRTLAVMGVGNDELVCQIAQPPLSSIALSAECIGHDAARVLERLIEREPRSAAHVQLPPTGVVARGSSDRQACGDADVATALRFIRLHLRDHLSVSDIVRESSISRRSLELKFARYVGCAPAAQIRRAKIEAAKLLLAGTSEPMGGIALGSGFRGARHLLGVFSRDVQMTPSAYRRSAPSPHARSPSGAPRQKLE